MKLTSLISFAFLVGSVASAQSAGNSGQSFGTAGMQGITTFGVASVAHSCPVSLRAQHGADGNILKVDKRRPAGLAQLLHLVLGNPDARQIVQGSLTVRGISGKGRIAQAQSSPDNADVVRYLEVQFVPQEGRKVAGDVWAPGMTAVLTVELNSVTFADGSMWRFAGRDGCRVAPDPLMLIAGR